MKKEYIKPLTEQKCISDVYIMAGSGPDANSQNDPVVGSRDDDFMLWDE